MVACHCQAHQNVDSPLISVQLATFALQAFFAVENSLTVSKCICTYPFPCTTAYQKLVQTPLNFKYYMAESCTALNGAYKHTAAF